MGCGEGRNHGLVTAMNSSIVFAETASSIQRSRTSRLSCWLMKRATSAGTNRFLYVPWRCLKHSFWYAASGNSQLIFK